MPEPLIDEINDTGIVLEDGYALSFVNLARIMDELSPTSLLHILPSIRKRERDTYPSVSHISEVFTEAARLVKGLKT